MPKLRRNKHAQWAALLAALRGEGFAVVQEGKDSGFLRRNDILAYTATKGSILVNLSCRKSGRFHAALIYDTQPLHTFTQSTPPAEIVSSIFERVALHRIHKKP